jgi:hypothetical protein
VSARFVMMDKNKILFFVSNSFFCRWAKKFSRCKKKADNGPSAGGPVVRPKRD